MIRERSASSVTTAPAFRIVEPEEFGGIEPRVHAGDDGELPAGRHREIAFFELRGVGEIGFADLVDDRHQAPPRFTF